MSDEYLKTVGVRKDYEDLRDQVYQPSLHALPAEFWPDETLFRSDDKGGRHPVFGVRHQRETGRCVGCSLAALIDIQKRQQDSISSNGDAASTEDYAANAGRRFSANMIYNMARFHEAYRNDANDPDERTYAEGGSPKGVRTLRSAIKAFHHHGVCPEERHGDTDNCWPTDQQARAAERCGLGAYYRLPPILNHYHAALLDTHSILVSARIHPGWRNDHAWGTGEIVWNGGHTPPQGPEASRDNSVPQVENHAFVIIGYTEEGFLILNSWGDTWGGWCDRTRARFSGAPLAGVGLWSYADWAHNLLDGWVVRLGVAGQHAFPYGIGEQGFARNYARAVDRATRGSTPHRELRNRFLNLEDGMPVAQGAYATPKDAIGPILSGFQAEIGRQDTRGVVLRFPSVLEPIREAFSRTAAINQALERKGIRQFTVFWCSSVAQDVLDIISSIVDRAREQAGENARHLDQLIEMNARGAGRAFWRDIERSAASAVFDRSDIEASLRSRRHVSSQRPGPVDALFGAVLGACRNHPEEREIPIHVVAEGAGALVVDELIYARKGMKDVPELTTLVLSLPAIPVRRASESLLPFINRMLVEAPTRKVTILVADEELEHRLRVVGYGKSILHLVANSFLDRSPAVDGAPQLMLGMNVAGDPKQIVARFLDGETKQMRAAKRATKAYLPISSRQLRALPRGAVEQSALMRDPGMDELIEEIVAR